MKKPIIIAVLLAIVVIVTFFVVFMGLGGEETPEVEGEDNICIGEHKWEFSRLSSDSASGEYLIYECTECDETKTVGVDEAEHSFVLDSDTDHVDCQTVINVQLRCTVCGWRKSMEGLFGNHIWSGSSSAFCGEEGTFERTCSVCGESESGTTLGLDHDLRYGTDSESENRYEYCTRCEYTTGGAD